MLKRILPILLASAVLLTACGAPAAPAMTADIPLTADAAARTIIALTNAAIPTETPVPPTEVPSPTPLPTFTPDILSFPPTVAFPTLSVPPTQASGGDPCAQILDTAAAGVQVNGKYIRFINQSSGTATVALTLTSPNSFGQCGYLTGFNNIIKKGAILKLRIPSGCWIIFASIQGKNGKNSSPYLTHCLGDSKADEVNTINIKDDFINWVGP